MVNITTLTSRQYCVILDPCDESGHPQLGRKKLVKVGIQKSFLKTLKKCVYLQRVCLESKNPLAYSINLFLYVVAVKYNKENIYLVFFVDRESDLSFCCLENGL